jgi:hypothetical protein
MKNLDRMRELYGREGNEAASVRTSGRITEIVEDLLDLRSALAEFDERDGKIRTGSE